MHLSACGEAQVAPGDGPPLDATAEVHDQAMGAEDLALNAVDQAKPPADAAPLLTDAATLLDAARPPADAMVIAPLDATAQAHDQARPASDLAMPLADAAPPLADAAPPLADAEAIPEPRSIAIANHSFEAPATGPGTFLTRAAPPSWRVYGNGIDLFARTVGVLNPATTTLYADPVPDGSNVGVTFLLDNPANQGAFAGIEAGMEQTLAETLQSETDYTLAVEVGNIAVDQEAPFQFGGFPGYRIEFFAGAERIGFDDNTLRPGEGRFLTSTVRVEIGPMHPQAGEPLMVRLVNLNAAAGIEVNFDNVRLVASR